MTESISFYLDEHVARGLSSREVNVLTAASAGMLESSDVEHLTFATVEGRVLFSQDADFLRLHAAGHEHAGIVHSPQQTSIGTIVVGLMLIFEVMSPEEMENHLEFL